MSNLSTEERGAIEYGLEKGLKVSEIALELNRNPSTIYREIKRYSMAVGKDSYYATYPYRIVR